MPTLRADLTAVGDDRGMEHWGAGPGLRWTRAAVLAACGTIGGSLFHASADGRLPDPTVLVAIWVASTAAVAPLLRHELGAERVVGLLVAWQAGVHVALGALGEPAAAVHVIASSSAAPATTGGHHAAHAALVDAPGVLDVALATLSAHAPMALGHAAAAALAGLWLAAGERALWSLLALSRQRLCVPAVDVLRSWLWSPGDVSLPLRPGPVSTLADAAPARFAARWWATCVGRRGPPVFC
jgi:hypothetical protein